MNHRNQTILAIDPGTRELGYAILAGNRLLTASVLPLRHLTPGRRLRMIDEALIYLIRGYRPRTCLLEHVPNRPLDARAKLPELGRRLHRLAIGRRMRFVTYSARSARRTVAGNGWAGKTEAAEAIARRFPELRVQLTQDRKWKVAYWRNMYDAVAIGLHHQALTQPPSRSR